MMSFNKSNNISGRSKSNEHRSEKKIIKNLKSKECINEIIEQVDEEYKKEVVEFYKDVSNNMEVSPIDRFCKKVKLSESNVRGTTKRYDIKVTQQSGNYQVSGKSQITEEIIDDIQSTDTVDGNELSTSEETLSITFDCEK